MQVCVPSAGSLGRNSYVRMAVIGFALCVCGGGAAELTQTRDSLSNLLGYFSRESSIQPPPYEFAPLHLYWANCPQYNLY